MKLYTQTLSLIAIAAGVTFTTGCNSNESKTSEKPKTETTTQTETTAQTESSNKQKNLSSEYVSPLPDTAPVYKVGISAGYAPFEFKDEFGKVIGYDVDMVRAIGEEAGFKVEFYDIPFSTLEKSLAEGKYDFGMSSSFKNSDDFAVSKPYIRSVTGYLVKDESPYKTVEDLTDKRIAVQANTSLEEQLKEQSANIIAEDSVFLAIKNIFTDKADAAYGEDPILFFNLEQFNEFPMRIIDTTDSEKQRVVVSAVDNKEEVIRNVNDGLAKLKANGKYQKINEKWFGEYAQNIAIN